MSEILYQHVSDKGRVPATEEEAAEIRKFWMIGAYQREMRRMFPNRTLADRVQQLEAKLA